MPPMPQPETPTPPPKPKRGWFRRSLRWLLLLCVLVAIFHRPLFQTGVRLVLIKVAAKQNLKLDVHFSGTIFTNLTISGVNATPTGAAPSPVKKITIERVRLEYSIPHLIRFGVGEFLRSYEVTNADLQFVAQPSKSEPEKKQKRALAEDLNTLLGQPALYADRVAIRNFNVTVFGEDNVTQIKDFNLFLDPAQPGELRVARLQIPGVPLWENLAAQTSYLKRNLFIRDLHLAPELVIEELNFDASQRAQNKGSTNLKLGAFGGTFQFALAGSQLNKKGENLAQSYDTTLAINAEDISLENAAAYFGAPKPPVAKLTKFAVAFGGEPEKPRTWKGDFDAAFETISAGPAKIDRVLLHALFQSGRAEITMAKVLAGKNSVGATASLVLPESVNEFPSSDVDAQLQLELPELATLTAGLPTPIAGAIKGGGPVTLRSGQLKTDLTLTLEQLAQQTTSVGGAQLKIQAAKRIKPAPPGPLDELSGHLTAEVKDIRLPSVVIDSARLDVETLDDLVTLHALEIHRAENAITAAGTYRLPRDPKNAAASPVDARFSIQVPKLADFGLGASGHPLAGHLAGDGTIKLVNGALGGAIDLQGGDFAIGDFKSGALTAKVGIENNTATIETFALQLNATDQIAASGKAELRAPFPYEGGVLIDIASLAALKPLLAVFGAKQDLAGALHVDWNGHGDPAPPAPAPPPPEIGPPAPPPAPRLEHTGTLNLALAEGRVDKIDLSEIKLGGLYGPGFIQSTELSLLTGQTSFAGVLELREGKLKLRDIALQQGKLPVLTGYIAVPLQMENPQQLVPLDQRLAANINATNLDLEKLLAAFGQTAPGSGTISANIVASGTPLDPLGHIKIAGRKLQAKAAAKLAPADFDLDLHYSHRDLTLAAALKQPQIQPLTVKGHVPLDLGVVVKTGKLDPKTPLDLTVQLPPSSLAFVPTLAAAVRRIEGTLGVDVRVAGSAEKPILSGSAAVDLKGARLASEGVPSIGAFKARLGFAGDTLSFDTFQGELGGGNFKLGGNIKLPKLAEPVFDLRLQAKEVLVLRNDLITVRADSDVKVAGPLKAGSVTGALFITQSRFFKEIDILPFALPGKPKPAPRAVANTNTTVSFPQPPLRDWKFDLAIKTRADDPFLIRGNLANGAAVIDLHLAGTGLKPYLEGSVNITEFKATLPFSVLTVSRGFVYFSKDAPFAPSLDLQADSQQRDYQIHAYIYGKATDPQVQLSSEPPLPYADIVSLIATGTTASELTGSADALASKAALIAVQQLYRKIFKKNAPPEEKKPSDGNFLDRFQFELGALDNRTGTQEVTSRFKINDQYYLLGELGVDGNFTGGLKYLIRFR